MASKATQPLQRAIKTLNYMSMLTQSLKSQNDLLQSLLDVIRPSDDQGATLKSDADCLSSQITSLVIIISKCTKSTENYKNSQLVSFERLSTELDQFDEFENKYIAKNLGMGNIYIDDRLLNEELLNKLESSQNNRYSGDERFGNPLTSNVSPLFNSSSNKLDQIMSYDNYKYKRVNCVRQQSSSTRVTGKIVPLASNSQLHVDIPDEMINNTDDSKSIISLPDKNMPEEIKSYVITDLKKMKIKDVSRKYKVSKTAIRDLIIENELKVSFGNIKAGNNKVFKHFETEQKILNWMKEEYDCKGIFYNENDIRARAREISKHKDFMASNSWFYRFKSRYPYFFEKYYQH